jgi:hypothetical protein
MILEFERLKICYDFPDKFVVCFGKISEEMDASSSLKCVIKISAIVDTVIYA